MVKNRYSHFLQLGITLGARKATPEEAAALQNMADPMIVGLAWVHDKDNYSRPIGRQLVDDILTHPEGYAQYQGATYFLALPKRVLIELIQELRVWDRSTGRTLAATLRWVPRLINFPAARNVQAIEALAKEIPNGGCN